MLAVECVKWSVKPSMTMSQFVWYRRGSWQDVEKGRQLCPRIAQRLNVRPGPTHVHIGDGWVGENSLRFASSLTVFLNILLAFLILSARENRLMIAPHPTMSIGRKLLFTRSNQFTLDFARAFSYTYEVLLPCLGGYGGRVS